MKKILRIFALIFFFLLSITYSFVPILVHAPEGRIFFFVQEKRPYYPQHAGQSGRAAFLKYNLEKYVKFPAYQRRGRITFCNVLARDIFDDTVRDIKKYCFYFADFHYDITPVFPTYRHIYMNIQWAYKQANKAAVRGDIILHSMRQAQKRANQGEVIWGISAKYNHEFIVCPGEWLKEKGCMVAQAGHTNGIFRISDREVFGKNWEDSEIRFYEFKKRK